MSVEIIRDLWVCQDCLFALANGDYPEDETRAAEITAGETRELPYRWAIDSTRTEAYGDDPPEAEGADTREFSWSQCDCCRSRLGGSRHRCALVKHDAEGQ